MVELLEGKLTGKVLFNQIEEELGEVTDFEMVEVGDGVEIRYKSDSIDKKIYGSPSEGFKKQLLQCYLYCAKTLANLP